MSIRRKRLSVSLPADLVDQIDRRSKAEHHTRSGVIEEWLRYGAERKARVEYAAEIEAYYRSLTPEERKEDEAIARAAVRSSRKLDFDQDRNPVTSGRDKPGHRTRP